MKVFRLFLTAIFILICYVSSSFAGGNFTLPFNGNHPVSYYYDLDSASGTAKGYNGGRSYDGHTGTDYATPNGTPILAMDEGKVVDVRDNYSFPYFNKKTGKTEYYENTYNLVNNLPDSDPQKKTARNNAGNYVIIEHPDGTRTSYVHLEKGSISVKKDDKLGRGQPIGKSDNAGYSSGPHLHITVKDKTGKKVDPYYNKMWTTDPPSSPTKGDPNAPQGNNPGGDHPDDTFDVSSGFASIDEDLMEGEENQPDYPDTFPYAFLDNGFYQGIMKLFEKSQVSFTPVQVDFSPQIVNEQKVLAIPSSGLYGLENSTFFKASLDEYVQQGGTLIVFAQQHGYEFSILPVPQESDGTFKQITGYGWTEDQSCFTNAVYFDTWHQILSGQSRSTPTLNVDGYFTNYPSNATVILRRTANGQPAMISYPYGNGLVIVTSMYSDWAYGHSQASTEEIALIRDMISWAKKPATLPEIKPGETVTVSVTVQNNTTTDAASVKLTITDPNRTVVSEQLSGVSVPAGSSSQLTTQYSTTTTALGIYHIDYTLLDAQGNTIQLQAETDSGRFAVSNPPTDNPYKPKDLLYSINTASENALPGEDVSYTVTIWNNSDVDKRLRLWKDFTHWWDVGFLEEVVVSAKGSISRTYTQNMLQLTGWAFDFATIWVHFFEENGSGIYKPYGVVPSEAPPYAYMGSVGKRLKLSYPSVNIAPIADKAFYAKGETVTLTVNLQNKQNISYAATLNVKVSDPSNAMIYSQAMSVNLPANGTSTQSLSFALSSTAQIGSYTISAETYDTNGKKIGVSYAGFELPQSQISITPNLPSAFISGSNTISFILSNTGGLSVSSGSLDVSLKDPDGIVIYSGSQPFSIGVAQGIEQNVNISIPSLKFGSYTLTYTQSDETRTGSLTSVSITNTATIALSFDKSSYRIREMANLTVNLTNTGKFNIDNATMTVSVPDAGYTDMKAITIGQGQALSLQYAIPIPETVTADQHDVNVTLTLPSGSSTAQSSKFTIPESQLAVGYAGQTALTAGDILTLTIENTGGVDTSYATQNLYIVDSKDTKIYQGSATGTSMAGEKKTLAYIQIPSQTADGFVLLSLQVKDNKTLKVSYLYKTFEIAGLSATLQTRTDKDAYLKTEAVTGLSSILNGQFGIENGSLKIAVNSIKGAGTGQFTHFLPKEGQASFYYPSGVAVATNGSVYVVDSYNHRIQKFDSNGNFVTMWGSSGSGDGQFNYPYGIAVAPDGSVYVADTENGRIQKFDANGNFIYARYGWTYFGRFQFFKYPYGIAVSSDGAVYVADTWNSRIVKFDGNGSFITMWGNYGSGDGSFNDPYGVSISPDGSIYVADTFNHRIQKFDINRNFITQWGTQGSSDGQFNYPFGIAVGPDGAVYVSDLVNRIQKFDSNGNFIKKWAGSGSGDGQFNSPWGIAIAPDNAVYVADFANNRIQRMVEGGIETLFETTIPITQSANTAQDYTANIGTLNTTGKFYLQAMLTNNLGQTIATSEYPFYIVEGNTVLLFNTNKKIYKPGETVTINGEVKNFATVSLDNAVLTVSSGATTLINQTITIPANGTYPFTTTTTAGSAGTVFLTGKVSQSNSTLVEISDQYEIANPSISATITAPDVVGKESFTLNLELKNDGKVDVSVQASVIGYQLSDNQQLTILAGETKPLQYTQTITQSTTYTLNITGDVTKTLAKQVVYGEAAQIGFTAEGVYPEGENTIPVTITNTGQIGEQVEVNFQLSQQSAVLSQQSKTYYLPKGGSVSDTLYYDLTEGNYQLTANSQLPTASVQVSFAVRKENKVDMVVSVGAQNNGLIPVTVNLTNLGYNEINGTVQLSVVNDQGVAVWKGELVVLQLSTQNSQLITFNVNPFAIIPADYTLKVELFNTANQRLALSTQLFAIYGATFQITQLPPYQTFTVGQEGSFNFSIKNTGNQEGEMSFTVKAMDILDRMITEWLRPGEEKTVTFNFLMPEDLEEKDYFADYELKGQVSGVKGQVKYHVAGVNLSVTATLDKQNYNVGDTAHLTLQITDNRVQKTDINLFARVNYAGYESNQPFTLNGSQTLTFDIPLAEITGEKLFYGIYYESGRSIHLNSLYIYRAGDVINITTGRQVYNPGESVTVTVTGNTSGQMTLAGPGNYMETFAFNGSATKSFTLPTTMTAGTYYIIYQMTDTSGQTYTGSHAIDINGIQVKVKEASLDKAKYAATDAMKLNLTIESNQNLSATLKTWIVDPDGSYTQAGSQAILLSSSEPLLTTGSWSLTAVSLGIHRLVYGIYTGDLLLSSGSEAFDVGDAVLLGVSTDRADYPNGDETIEVTSSMYGTVSGALEYLIDGVSSHTESISMNGFVTHTINIYPSTLSPGLHTLKVVLTAGGLSSTKEVNFVYASLVSATIDIDPDTLNKKSKGQWVTCYIELPVGYRAEDIDISSLLLQGAIPAETQPTAIGDYDADGVSDLMVKFDRQRLQSILPTGENVKITLTGRLKNGKNIKGDDYIKVIE